MLCDVKSTGGWMEWLNSDSIAAPPLGLQGAYLSLSVTKRARLQEVAGLLNIANEL